MTTDEGGLWAMMDREDARLRRSPFAIKDAALAQYVGGVACRLAGDHCPDLRVHIVRTPYFNATMAPNGMMQVWSGLLLRCDNEAQLAAVLGHEIGHYLERHTLQRLREAKDKAALAQFLGAFGIVGGLVGLGVVGGIFAFTRDQEARADRIGMQLMQAAGYDGTQAAHVWDNLLSELRVRGGENAGKRSPMFATHPPVEDRRDTLLKLAGDGGGTAGTTEFERATAANRFDWLQDELRRGQPEESLSLFNRWLSRNPGDALALYARGETFRVRDAAGDAQSALADLAAAAADPAAPPDAQRSLGLLHRKQARPDAAADAFERYLALAPQAADAGLIKTYLKEMNP